MSARAAQAFFEQCAGYLETVSREDARRVELHHLHVAKRSARLPGDGHAVGGEFLRAGGDFIERGAAARGEERAFRVHGDELPVLDVEQQRARDPLGFAPCGQKRHRARFFQHVHPAPDELFRDAVCEFDARQIALVHRSVEALAGEGFLVDRAVLVSVEKTAAHGFEPLHAAGRAAHERPGEFLIVNPRPALQGVEKMVLHRVGFGEGDVVAALHHARAAAFPK